MMMKYFKDIWEVLIERSLFLKLKIIIFLPSIRKTSRGQFHQHFMSSFFMGKFFVQLFSSYILDLGKGFWLKKALSYKKRARRLLMKLTPEAKNVWRISAILIFCEFLAWSKLRISWSLRNQFWFYFFSKFRLILSWG